MLDFNTYKSSLLSNGSTLAQVRKNQSDNIINITFTGDPTYKRCRVLTTMGWEWVDAKYQKHTTPSILKDEVDYYLQFRPGVHFKLGTYVIVPDDTSPDVNTPDDPFDQEYNERTQWWLIVGRTDANAYVRYSILKCNYDFIWIYENRIRHCFGCVRNASSYTSGVWAGDKTVVLDNINSAWLPDVGFTYGDNYESFGLDDIKSIDHKMRFMITDNHIHPKTYEVSKVTELVPAGIIKLTLKQVPFNEKLDNIQLGICNYYDENGTPLIHESEDDIFSSYEITSKINMLQVNDAGEMVGTYSSFDKTLHLRKSSYFTASFSDNYDGSIKWGVSLVGEYSNEEKNRLEQYIELVDFEDGTISIKPNRIKDLIGKRFELSVFDEDHKHYSSIVLEVDK